SGGCVWTVAVPWWPRCQQGKCETSQAGAAGKTGKKRSTPSLGKQPSVVRLIYGIPTGNARAGLLFRVLRRSGIASPPRPKVTLKRMTQVNSAYRLAAMVQDVGSVTAGLPDLGFTSNSNCARKKQASNSRKKFV